MQIIQPLFALVLGVASLPVAAGSLAPSVCSFVEGNLTLASGSTLTIDIGGEVSGCDASSVFFTEFDRVFVAGVLDLGGATLKLVLRDGYVPPPGARFEILAAATLLGDFGTIDTSQAPLPDGGEWDTSRLLSDGTIQVPSAAPEQVPLPAWALVAGGIGLVGSGVGWRPRRR